jgi:hypothetical protein
VRYSRAMTRMLPASLTVMVCLAVGACGDTSQAPPKAAAGRDSGLGVKRFAALDSVYAAAAPLDKHRGQKVFSFARFRADAKPLLKACDALPDDDALMRAMRSGCPLIGEFIEQGATVGTCDSKAACLRSMLDFRRFVKRLLAVSRRSDRVVAAEQKLAQECKHALTTPAQAYAVFEGYDAGIGLMQRALRSPSPAALDNAAGRLGAADRGSKALPSYKVLVERFRSGCD